MTDYESLVPQSWYERLGWDALTPAQRSVIGEYGFYMFRLGSPTVEDIDEVKYDGRLVILDDGTRWEVDAVDAFTAEMWGSLTKVAVLDGVMYNLDSAEHVDVTEE